MFYILLTILFFFSPAYAEVFQEFKSPWTTEARNPLLVGTGLTLTVLIFEDQTVDPVQKDTTEDKPLGRYSSFAELMGQLVPNAIYYGGMKINYWLHDNQDSNVNAEIMLKSTIYASAVTNILKYTIREHRPTGNAKNSFPSGHTTSAFAFASSVYAIHGAEWGIPALLLASLVGYSRINDNQHYLHDVLAGATIGTVYGLGITYLLKKSINNTSTIWYPLINDEKLGLGLCYLY